MTMRSCARRIGVKIIGKQNIVRPRRRKTDKKEKLKQGEESKQRAQEKSKVFFNSDKEITGKKENIELNKNERSRHGIESKDDKPLHREEREIDRGRDCNQPNYQGCYFSKRFQKSIPPRFKKYSKECLSPQQTQQPVALVSPECAQSYFMLPMMPPQVPFKGFSETVSPNERQHPLQIDSELGRGPQMGSESDCGSHPGPYIKQFSGIYPNFGENLQRSRSQDSATNSYESDSCPPADSSRFERANFWSRDREPWPHVTCIRPNFWENRQRSHSQGSANSSYESDSCQPADNSVFERENYSARDGEHRPPVTYAVSKLGQDLKGLFISGENSDVTLKVKETEFKVHKNILGARSSTFKSMFQHEMKENLSNVVIINDFDADIFEVFLLYLYSEEVQGISIHNVVSLHKLADFYNVMDLTSYCISYMINNLSVETFCDFFTVAIDHSESEIIKICETFFDSNFKDIISTLKWQIFAGENPEISKTCIIRAFDKKEVVEKS